VLQQLPLAVASGRFTLADRSRWRIAVRTIADNGDAVDSLAGEDKDMRIKLSYITPLIAAGAAAVAIVAAPTAFAQSCDDLGAGQTECQSPGNVQINDSPGPVQYTPQYPYWEGDLFSHGGYGGGHTHR
jgi:hypothetical protein